MTTEPERHYRQLEVWKRALDLVEAVYTLTESFPPSERFGLSSQLRRAVVSIASNIAEGNERESQADHRHFVTMARASLAEVDTQLEIALRLGYTTIAERAPILARIDELGRRLFNLRRKLPW